MASKSANIFTYDHHCRETNNNNAAEKERANTMVEEAKSEVVG